jgi:UDP-4-amino-4,6-dideoxy-N-acetyl-beta-L-altrosamine N-acetyltransferase
MIESRCTLRPMLESDLWTVLQWRNHPSVRGSMLSQHEISEHEHSEWFRRGSTDATRVMWIGEDTTGSLGFVHFTGIKENSTAEWGFYAAPGAAPGAGTRVCAAALDMIFHDYPVHKVFGQVLSFNSRSLRLHERLGFRREGRLREHQFQGERHFDLICFGLIRNEWKPSREV